MLATNYFVQMFARVAVTEKFSTVAAHREQHDGSADERRPFFKPELPAAQGERAGQANFESERQQLRCQTRKRHLKLLLSRLYL